MLSRLPACLLACSANRLFTVNGTCRAEDLEQYGAVLRQMVESFRPPPAMA